MLQFFVYTLNIFAEVPEEEKKDEPLPPPIDAQKLTLSDQEVVDVDLVLTPTRTLPDGTIEGIPFVPDDASSDAQEAEESEEVF